MLSSNYLRTKCTVWIQFKKNKLLRFFFYFPKWSNVKLMFCGGGHLRFHLSQKTGQMFCKKKSNNKYFPYRTCAFWEDFWNFRNPEIINWPSRHVEFQNEIENQKNVEDHPSTTSTMFKSSRWALGLRLKASKTLFGPVNFSVFLR